MHAGCCFATTAVLGLALATAPARAQAPRDIVARALQAMGGEAAVRGIAGVTGDYHVVAFSLGQAETAESPPRASVAYGSVATDWRGQRRARVQELRAVAGPVTRVRRVTAGSIGLLEIDGRQTADGAGVVAGIERAMRRDPEHLLLQALDSSAALSGMTARQWRDEPHLGVRHAIGPDTLELWFDRRSGLLTVVEAVSDHPILGDQRTVTWYTRWQDAGGGVRLPRQMDVMVNGQLQEHWVFTAVRAGSAVPDSLFAIPDSIAARAPRASATPPAVTVRLVELAPGVWRAEGGSHHSLVVEQPDQLVVVEAPQSRARTQAVLDTVRARFPGKPIGTVVNTHHHWDHAGGLRTAMAAGIPIVTHAVNAAFVRRIAEASKTVQPDELSRRRRAPVVRAVQDSLVIGAGDTRLVVYAMPTIHAEGVVAAYVPAARLLFTSDVLSPGATLAPVGSAEVAALARARGIAVERFAGGHGGVAAWADLERAAAR